MIMRDSSAAICHRYEREGGGGEASREMEEREKERDRGRESGGGREGSVDLLFSNPATNPTLHGPLAYS